MSRWIKGKSKSYVLVKRLGHHRANNIGYVHRSVLVMEEHLGRYLTCEEEVHHINGDVTDDRIENLELLNRQEHQRRYNNLDKYNHSPRNTKGRPFLGNQYRRLTEKSV